MAHAYVNPLPKYHASAILIIVKAPMVKCLYSITPAHRQGVYTNIWEMYIHALPCVTMVTTNRWTLVTSPLGSVTSAVSGY